MTINDSIVGKPLRESKPSVGVRGSEKAKKPPQHEPIAVVGMGCRLPGESSSPHALWKFLERGGIARTEPPASRFSLKSHYDGSGKPHMMGSPGGMFIENHDPQDIDAAFFSLSSTEATALDPQQRQLLEVVYECLENAGLPLESLSGAAVACVVGSYAGDYETIQSRDPEDRAPNITVGIGRAMLSNRISHFLNIKGPSMTIDTACSGALQSLDVACRYLQTREVDGAIIAAANMYLNPDHCMDRGAMKAAASATARCHTFDVKADGYIKGEAVNAVYLKRLDDAIRDGDPIRAVIRGTATNSDGYTPGIASPSSEAQAAAVRAAYANAGISDMSETSYVECHGTGTQAGDPTEVSGVSSAFETEKREQPLIIGSIKSNVGHSEPAAGLSGLIKAILALEHDVIPGNPTFIDPNPKIEFDRLRVRASRTAIPWPKKPFKRASVNSFGYGGSNAHVVLDETAKWSTPRQVSSYRNASQFDDFFSSDAEPNKCPPHLLVFSANDEVSLPKNVSALAKHLMSPEVSVKLEDLAYTLSERRTRHFNRGFLVSRSSTSLDESALTTGKLWNEAPRIGFVFTGQGAQWSEMGKQLVETFPRAKFTIQRLDKALQAVPNPPKWSLLKELVEPRNPQVLRQPEFSQPLVTALQLAVVDVLRSFGIKPQSVVGHSSGEIVAACAAGYLTEENAIKAAFYRGQAAVQGETQGAKSDVGMLAVGLGPDGVAEYLAGLEDQVQIACFNSPKSVTLSGAVPALNQIKDLLVEDGHFARLLQVNLAYHSKYMAEIGEVYECMLERNFNSNIIPEAEPKMFSSVLGREMDQPADVQYWKTNMVSPVKFDEALKQMISGKGAANFLIEVGPSKALAGPVGQIKDDVAGGTNVEYCGTLSRGAEAINSLFDVAGRLFTAGAPVDLMEVNRLTSTRPSIIIDLPNYVWNHSIKYWYENQSSKDWRYRLFPHHDLVGTKILGTSWHSPSWRKTISLDDLPWLKDHMIGGEILFPAAGFMAMAVEAVSQVTQALAHIDDVPGPKDPCYRLRDSTFPKALVLDESKPTKVMLSLARRSGKDSPWYEYKAFSLSGDSWVEHCRGLVRAEENRSKKASSQDIRPLRHATDSQLWYRALQSAGFQFGPLFQRSLEVESVSGKRSVRSKLDLTTPTSTWGQSSYPMHPACIDGCLQSVVPAVWHGNRTAVDHPLIPAIIDDILICPPKRSSVEVGISLASSKYGGLGRPDVYKNNVADAKVYDPETGDLLFQLNGLHFHQLDNTEEVEETHKFTQLQWKPDPTFMSHNDAYFSKLNAYEFMDLIAFKMPTANVAELNLLPGNDTSVWIDAGAGGRNTAQKFTYLSSDAKALVSAQQKYSGVPASDFQVFDPASTLSTASDLAIIRMDVLNEALLKYAVSLCHPNGHVYIVEQDNANQEQTMALIQSKSFGSCHPLPGANAWLVAIAPTKEQIDTTVKMVRFRERTEVHDRLAKELESIGWSVIDYPITAESEVSGPVIVVDELESPLLAGINGQQWDALKTLLSSRSPILWLTEGSQYKVTHPTHAMIHGLARSVRAEDPDVHVATIDIEEGATGPRFFSALRPILLRLQQENPAGPADHEYAVRDGCIYVSRVLSNDLVNKAVSELSHGRELQEASLHDHPGTIRLRTERVGALEGLSYFEVSAKEEPLQDGHVEIELHAAGMNFKDLAIAMGTVPENEWMLGHEGAGVVRRSASPKYKPGDRVIAFSKRTFANRVITEPGRLRLLPDWMTFEEAASIPCVYLTAVYALFDLAKTQAGQRVLVHSAAGGVGIACIQLCRYIGAEIFVTVGSEEKRKFLREEYGIPDSHIFHSRTPRFAAELMEATDNEGVDVVINTLTGELLEESWRSIREGGTFIELGKKDIVDRNYLPMEPFARNVSYHAFDMGHRRVDVDADFIEGLFDQLWPLVEQRTVKPITPMKVFPWDDISAAFHYMRGGKHMGKIVISNGSKTDINVQMRPQPRILQLRADASYLLVGGLKGLCGSLAVHLARRGAQHLVVLARSGYADAASQAAIANIESEGCRVQLMVGDVSNLDDVRRVFNEAKPKIAGVLQGAMVLRDKIYASMTVEEYHQAADCKVKGTWNLHNAALETQSPLDFFSLLSSISGVVGQRGQANYAAANAFLDAFAAYRRGLGLRANSIDLGAIEEVGYISRNTELLQMFDPSTWSPINEKLFLSIVEQSLLQQVHAGYPASDDQLITGLSVPLGAESPLLADARFSTLRTGDSQGAAAATDGKDKEIATFVLLARGGGAGDAAGALDAAVGIVNRQFQKILRLPDPMEPAKALSSYGLDSLAAVELRNWIRKELQVDLTTLDITNAKSLLALCEKILQKIHVAASS